MREILAPTEVPKLAQKNLIQIICMSSCIWMLLNYQYVLSSDRFPNCCLAK